MITTALCVAWAYVGFRLGARYTTLTNMSDRARTKVRGWLSRGDTQ